MLQKIFWFSIKLFVFGLGLLIINAIIGVTRSMFTINNEFAAAIFFLVSIIPAAYLIGQARELYQDIQEEKMM